jgi:hypothetical protein
MIIILIGKEKTDLCCKHAVESGHLTFVPYVRARIKGFERLVM